MGNFISKEKYRLAQKLFIEGKSHREVSKSVNIAKYTAYKIYRNLWTAKDILLKDVGIIWNLPSKRKGGYWDHKMITKAKFKCVKCNYEYEDKPGPTSCPKCKGILIEWINGPRRQFDSM